MVQFCKLGILKFPNINFRAFCRSKFDMTRHSQDISCFISFKGDVVVETKELRASFPGFTSPVGRSRTGKGSPGGRKKGVV